jgi:hypothetical protein
MKRVLFATCLALFACDNIPQEDTAYPDGGVAVVHSALTESQPPPGYYACQAYSKLPYNRLRYLVGKFDGNGTLLRVDCFESDIGSTGNYTSVQLTNPDGSCGQACPNYHVILIGMKSWNGGAFALGCPFPQWPNFCPATIYLPLGQGNFGTSTWDQGWPFSYVYPTIISAYIQ